MLPSHPWGGHWVLLRLLPLFLWVLGPSASSNSPGAAPCLGALASLTLLSSGVLPGHWRKKRGGDQVGTWQAQKLQEGQWLNFLRNLQFVVISLLPAWATLLGWELNNPQVGLGNKCCSPDAQGILEQGFKSTFKGAKRLPEVMLSPGYRR